MHTYRLIDNMKKRSFKIIGLVIYKNTILKNFYHKILKLQSNKLRNLKKSIGNNFHTSKNQKNKIIIVKNLF